MLKSLNESILGSKREEMKTLLTYYGNLLYFKEQISMNYGLLKISSVI
jgi:hypothetical protein